jgi:hypothetical protein
MFSAVTVVTVSSIVELSVVSPLSYSMEVFAQEESKTINDTIIITTFFIMLMPLFL